MSCSYRSRPLRGLPTSPLEREPFSERLSRPKKTNAILAHRKPKYGSENVPPEDDNVKPSHSNVEGGSPSPAKMASRSRPPRPPLPPRATGTPPARRKLGLECPTEYNTSFVSDKAASDTGVKVIIRIRPMRAEEKEVTQVVHMLSPNTITVIDQQFSFDAVAGMDSTQKEIFEMVGLPLVENCMAGFNSSIFAYGQTGSGKTYSMWGPTCDSSGDKFPNKDRGLTPRVFEQLFARIQEEEGKNADRQLRYQCRCSFLEIYNEQITDLLEPNQKNLQIREDVKTGVYVENLTEEYVSSVSDVTQIALRGLANRRVGSTSMNAESSRSHSVFTCVLESRCKSLSDGVCSLRTSRINLVDLAGSERQKLTGAAGERLKEAGNINRSLSQLGNLIKILAEVSQTGKQRHIPYRDSRLTFLLQESLGGNAKLAMVCAISPSGSCRSETMSTLRFAQRAKAIQNKAVVNEETENDVNLLRDQIRQLKDELMRMKSKDSNQPAGNGGYSTGWNARRSLSLLRMSLAPLTLSHMDTDSDEDMEIDEDAVEGVSLEKSSQSTYDDESLKDSRTSSSSEKEEMQADLSGLQRENIDVKPKAELNTSHQTGDTSHPNRLVSEIHLCAPMDDEVCKDDFVFFPDGKLSRDAHTNNGKMMTKQICSNTDQTDSISHDPNTENSDVNKEKEASSPTLSIVPCPSSPILLSPPLSVSPRVPHVRKSMNKSLHKSTLSPPDVHGSDVLNLSFEHSVRKSSHIQSDTSQTSTPDQLAASLQRGLEKLDHHHQSSGLRKSSVRFSFQHFNKMPQQLIDKVDKAIQTSPKGESTSATSVILHDSCQGLDIVKQTVLEDRGDIQDKSQWQLIPVEENRSSARPNQVTQAVEGVLAGSIRREMALEEVCNKQAAEIEHLNRLVHQYKHERECNSMIQQAREEKIARLESLIDGAITTEDYRKDELESLAFEYKLLEEKYQNHPEVTQAKLEEKHLLEELEKYRNFYELGERDALIEEMQNLRTQLQYYLELSTSSSAKKLRMSVTKSQRPELIESSPSQALCTISEVPHGISDTLSDKKWEEENREWTERENEWISLVDDLRAELNSVTRLAEKRKKELESEQTCAGELKEALQMAMEAHARILDQYAELQEKYMVLRGKHRKIREGVADAKRAAVTAGMKGTELAFIETQSAELMALKLDREQEHQMMQEEINGLEAQLSDTVDAVQAAGELVVRLKDAEEAVSIAEDALSRREQHAEALRRDIEKLKRRHATEIATLNQRLLESRLQKSSVCPMCQVAERVKFEFTDGDDATLEADSATNEAQQESKGESEKHFPHEFEEHDEFLQMDKPSWFGYDACNI
ncbi:kinesin-like protein KIN-12B isoform X1 [Cryptomeria japonica]|uniref:kinesin-like protein KIN-12B isoform X1 n=1 Tax=Cryptomeria japonica TaxID=3369 RepID=UPI0027DA742F|nr:kinesin-like protein KIN-12B isoform X1 [Cryptomeria japonica]